MLGVEAAQQLAAQLLGRQLDRCQRILDLMGQAARHLPPGRAALRVKESGHIVVDDDQARRVPDVRQRRACPQQHARASLILQGQLFAPFALARIQPRAQCGHEARQQVSGPDPGGQALAHHAGQITTQDRARRLVGTEQLQLRIDHQHAARESREDHREPLALALDRLPTQRGFLTAAPQPFGHVIERVHQESHLIARGQRQAGPEITLAHGAGAGDQILDRTRQPLRRPDRSVDRRQHRDQQHQRQGQHEIDLERPARGRHVPVIGIGVLDRVREPGQFLRHVVVGEHKAPRGRVRGPRERRGGHNRRAPAGGRLQADIAVTGGNLHQQPGRRPGRER